MRLYTRTLPKGRRFWHGTSGDWDETTEQLAPRIWVSDSYSVAAHFARRGNSSRPRVALYRATEPIPNLLTITSKDVWSFIEDEYALDVDCTEDMIASVEHLGYNGWWVPNNYPDGDDIYLIQHGFEHIRTEALG